MSEFSDAIYVECKATVICAGCGTWRTPLPTRRLVPCISWITP